MYIFIIALLGLTLLIYCISRNKTPTKSIEESKKMEERIRNHRKRMIAESSKSTSSTRRSSSTSSSSSSSSNRSSYTYDDSGSYGGKLFI